MGSPDTVVTTTSTKIYPDDDIIPQRLPWPVAKLQPPILPKGAVLTNLVPLLSAEAVAEEEKVKEMEVQRMVTKTPTPDWLMPENTSTRAEAQPRAEAVVAEEKTTEVAAATVVPEAPPADNVEASSSQSESESTQPDTQTTPTIIQTAPPTAPSGMDVSTLLGPDLFKTKTNSSSRDSSSLSTRHRASISLGSNSNDSSSTLAPPTPGTSPSDGNTSSSDESEDDPVGDYADTDDEAEVPLPLFLVRDGQADDVLGTVADEDDLAWADVSPPAALTEILQLPEGGDIPELLREIVASSLESVQAQLAVAVTEKAERGKVKAAEAEAAAAARAEEKRRRQEQLERERKEMAALAKGKARDTATRHIPDPVEHRPPVQTAVGPVKKSRRHMFASRMLRHVHILGSSNGERGESSAAGAAAAAEAAQAAQARAALQRAYEQAQLRSFDNVGSSSSSSSKPVITRKPVKKLADKMAGPSRQQAYEQAMLRALEGTASSSTATPAAFTAVGVVGTDASTASTTTTTTTLPGTQPIPTQRRAAMLLAMVRKDMEKKKEPVLPATIECISCFEDVPRKEAVQTVCHAYCLDCFQQLVTTALANEAQFPPKCCLNEVPAATVNKYVPRDLARQYKAKVDEFATPVGDRVYCPTVDCGVFVPAQHIAKAARIARCRNGHETCTACRQDAHGRGSQNREACPEASAQDQLDQRLADELAAEEGWRRCIRCAVLIEHREACQHMTCRCGAEFCYVCGLAWRTSREARERDRIRRQAEQADAELAELRDALAQVAAFEQRERQKLQRIQQAQRARLQQLKQQREIALEAEVAAKYDALRTTLATLGALQTTHAQQARRQERVAHCSQQTQDATDADTRLAKTKAEAADLAAAKIKEAEQKWNKDLAERITLEKRLEEEYRQLLEVNAAWTGRDDHPQLVESALRAYQRTNDARMDTYKQWKDRELANDTFLAEEERAVRDEVQDALRVKHTQQARKDRRALQRKHAGERVWCRAVAAERARLLAEMEVVEQGLGLAGSTSEADTNLLLLLDLEENGALAGDAAGEGAGAAPDDTEMNHLYAVMLADIASGIEDLDFGEGEGVEDVEEVVENSNVVFDDDDRDSFYSLYADENRNSGSGSGSGSGSSNNDNNNRTSNGPVRAEYNWPLTLRGGTDLRGR
ncbi:hypothetical protein Sste5346_004956 [Sporothrix stenoceras]|uniref:RBR-type E3 ubiquitin transferase n=1 Tax=Sporothrix stenoceras TaxID=5173 RepID=A0ABR3Z6G1_9PEZI